MWTGHAQFARREAATRALTDGRERIVATLVLTALAHEDAEVRERAVRLAFPVGLRLQPAGTQWANFMPGCGQNDPYEEELMMVACGMAFGGDARPYLQILSGTPQ